MAARATLVRPGGGTVVLPWWPDSITHTPGGVTYTEVERPGRSPLQLPQGRALAQMSVDATIVDGAGLGVSVEDHLRELRAIRASRQPVGLVLGTHDRGWWHMTDLTITEQAHTRDGAVAWAQVQITLRRASPATVNVGPIKTKR